MGNGEINRLPVNQLADRYKVARSAIYTRLNALNIEPEKVGNRAYINSEQLQLLDDLHRYLQSGGQTAEFLEMRGLEKAEDKSELSSGLSSGLNVNQPDIIRLVAMIASEIAAKFQPPPAERDRFAYFETLERAARNGWLLRSSEVAYLLELPESELRHYGDRFSEAGFMFTKAGYRSRGEVAWRVSKPLQ
ncbi:hypothetical protein [Thermocoleostomius sinensis]|uniref:Uncharacterized protein n=1 Tax=Thermocoleostomius sinensis A174 TaxID=2016057 RepID=A0A9E8ZME1_9CYAN|nr:hypothetical protein [Thermocoleostomius sinensis]WAL61151.1 hypothetical protein OXH18_03880 [Thermocoleostomius sinensis A174]